MLGHLTDRNKLGLCLTAMQLLAKQLCSWGGYIISAVFKIQGSENPKMHRMISEWPWKLYSQKYPACTNYSPPRSKFWPLSLHDKLFLRYKVVENWKNGKCTKLPQNELERLTIKSNLYTLVTPKAQILVCFTKHHPFSRYKVIENQKNHKCTEWPQNDFEHLTVKITMYLNWHLHTRPKFWPADLENFMV